MIPSPRITATPQLLLPLNNKLLGKKIKHRMSNPRGPCDSVLWPGKLCTDVGRSVTIMTARDNSWHVTMVRSHITHHLLVDRQFRVGHQIWHRSWHWFLCDVAPYATLSLCPDMLDNTNLAQCYTGINITTLSHKTLFCSVTNAQIVLTVFVSVQGHKKMLD